MFNRLKIMMAVALGRVMGRTPASLHRAAMDHNRTVDALRDVAESVPHKVNGYEHVLARVKKSFRMRRAGRRYTPNGIQECARRRRQIARGQLTVSNGLWFTNAPMHSRPR